MQKKDPKVKSLQLRFLAVFWLLRMADWLQVRTPVYIYFNTQVFVRLFSSDLTL